MTPDYYYEAKPHKALELLLDRRNLIAEVKRLWAELEIVRRSRDGWERDALNYAKSHGCQSEMTDAAKKELQVERANADRLAEAANDRTEKQIGFVNVSWKCNPDKMESALAAHAAHRVDGDEVDV